MRIGNAKRKFRISFLFFGIFRATKNEINDAGNQNKTGIPTIKRVPNMKPNAPPPPAVAQYIRLTIRIMQAIDEMIR